MFFPNTDIFCGRCALNSTDSALLLRPYTLITQNRNDKGIRAHHCGNLMLLKARRSGESRFEYKNGMSSTVKHEYKQYDGYYRYTG